MVLGNPSSDEERIRVLAQNFADARELRLDVPDGVWNSCLKVVLESVQTHSGLRPGECQYLEFIDHFIV